MKSIFESHEFSCGCGNTRMKYAFFDENRFIEAKYQADELFEDIGRWKETTTGLHILLSGSGKVPEDPDVTEGVGRFFLGGFIADEITFAIRICNPANAGF